MPGPLDGLRPRKRKSSSRKPSTTRRRCIKGPKTQPAPESSSAVSKAEVPLERLSRISCECHQFAGRRRCSASPELQGQEGKENELRTRLERDSCRVYGVCDKPESEDMDCEETSKNMFPDDDSNQILPVEQFFGNLDAIQDFPQRSSETSARAQREHRRRHYYAPEDSDEEEAVLGGMHGGDRGDA
ncbi:UPF0688 protein C1orf174 homolog [Anoplopoma fimbria]|uniref:UPF0688 protein C1orf174 homolog n=1 Tax=Anoplopoma fimbria TaxID=229290 RepID=UPI0023ECAA4F|nr:UPF0688 protein C1orf174 homolog [Anoplopoma fimbria]